MCEALSFNVWHGRKEMKPLSYINEVRRDLYMHTAAYRNVRNGVHEDEPDSWCDSLPSSCESNEIDDTAPMLEPASDSLTIELEVTEPADDAEQEVRTSTSETENQ